jgi:RNA methyltransferase, TrmH family
MPIQPITSLQNNRIKAVVKLAKRQERDARRVTVVEGVREIHQALTHGVMPLEVYLCPELVKAEEAQQQARQLQQLAERGQVDLYTVTPEVFAKLTYRTDSDGLLLVIPYLDTRLERFPLGKPPFLAVIESVEKPGNLGAILRTADAAGVDGVIVCAGATDLHNPNVIRASLGAIFTVPLAETTTSAAIAWLQQQQIQVVATLPTADTRYTAVDLSGPVAIVMGSEAHGLGREWRTAAHYTVSIPMLGALDSLNLATATALLLYEVRRQRR